MMTTEKVFCAKRTTFRATLRILGDLIREHLASEIVGLFFVAAVGQAAIMESPETVSVAGTVAIQGNAAIIEAQDSLLASGRMALPKVVQPAGAST